MTEKLESEEHEKIAMMCYKLLPKKDRRKYKTFYADARANKTINTTKKQIDSIQKQEIVEEIVEEIINIPQGQQIVNCTEKNVSQTFMESNYVSREAKQKSRQRIGFSKEEDNCLIDFIFNTEPEVDLSSTIFWNKARRALMSIGGIDRHYVSVKSRLRLNLVKTLHQRKELYTKRHESIAKYCYEFSFKNDKNVLCEKYSQLYHDARKNNILGSETNFNQTSKTNFEKMKRQTNEYYLEETEAII